jgi:hypothetical protein
MSRSDLSLPQRQTFGQTLRKDAWWLFPAITFIYFMSFVVYSTWAAFQGEHYWFSETAAYEDGSHAQYLSPFYSPVLYVDTTVDGHAPVHHAWLGTWPDWLPKALFGIIPITPALLILWAPGGFRFTCYYYRGAYYKAFWMDPVNCAVGEPALRGTKYRGERWFPLVLQNIHRYFLYIIILFNIVLTYDAVISYFFVQPDGSKSFGIGIGSLVLTANAILLLFYTLGCHSLRHLIGGRRDCIASNPAQYSAWKCASCFNRWHMQWAWISLFWVGFTDLYIRLCSMGIWSDWRIV